MKSKAVVSLVDDSTFLDYLIMMFSFKKYNSSLYNDIDKIMFTFGELCDENRLFLETVLPTIQEKKIDTSFYPSIKYSGSRDWCDKKSTYKPHYRYEIFTLTGYENLVYLDTDLLIMGDVSELFKIPEGEVAACNKWNTQLSENCNHIFVYAKTQCEAPDEEGAFNAGVMSFGKNTIKKNMRDEMLELHQKVEAHGNQRVFNLYFKNKISYLPEIYNFTTENSSVFYNIDDIAVLHFVGEKKPSHSIAQSGKKISDYLVIKTEDTSIYNGFDKALDMYYPKILALAFHKIQLDKMGITNALVFWLEWFKIFKEEHLFISLKSDAVKVTKRMESLK